jgi:hypothetical protein
VLVAVRLTRSRKITAVGRVIAFMGVKPLVFFATKKHEVAKKIFVPFVTLFRP